MLNMTKLERIYALELEMRETEQTKLLNDSTGSCRHNSNLSPLRQNVMLVSLLMLNLCVIMADSILYPFYGTAAKKKGLNNIHVGIVLTCFEAARFLAAPLYGILVRLFFEVVFI